MWHHHCGSEVLFIRYLVNYNAPFYFSRMVPRLLAHDIVTSLRLFPVVALVGSRQTGKTTLARAIAEQVEGGVAFLDLERPSDLTRLSDAELYLSALESRLVIIDEIQRRPDLFPLLRVLVDEPNNERRFLILGSASPTLSRQANESLAGRVVQHVLEPFVYEEVDADAEHMRRLWLRGGYPLSYLASSDEESLVWRTAFLSAYLERDIPQLGVTVPATTLRRFWTMLAHVHGQRWNASAIAQSMGVSPPTGRHYLDILSDTFMIRQLSPYAANVGKRLVKSPKVYLRDSGLLHALLGIDTMEALLGNPIAGASWEGWAVEQVLTLMRAPYTPYYYRTQAGAEIDLVVAHPSAPPVAVEAKLSLSPKLSRGFYEAFSDLGCDRGYVVYPGQERYPLGKGVEALPVHQLRTIFSA